MDNGRKGWTCRILDMDSVYVCFSLKSYRTCTAAAELLDKDYSSVYKPLAKFLYSHPGFCFSFAFNGPQLNFYKKKRKEFITILHSLVERRQSEILGSGYYDPIFPLIYSSDKSGQIDLMSAEIRKTLGRRPRGINLYADCWDLSLVSSLQSCGIEYTMIDSFCVPEEKKKFLPLNMTVLGKNVELFPVYSEFKPEAGSSVEAFIEKIRKAVEKLDKKDKYLQFKPIRIVNISLTHSDLASLLETNWLEKLSDYFEAHPDCPIQLSTLEKYRKIATVKVPAFIPSGLNHRFSNTVTKSAHSNFCIFDYLEMNPQGRSLNNRIMYVGMLVNQFKNDKMRKHEAREKLWLAQSGCGLIGNIDAPFSNVKERQLSYRYLMDAEKILRENGKFKESVLCFDYDGDGQNEYICRMQNYFSCISKFSGAIQELELLKNTGNYADNFYRHADYDGFTDDYVRGLFVDHIFSASQFEHYLRGEPAGDGVFSRFRYSELRFVQNHNEIQLCAEAVFVPTKQKVYLKKKYIINSTGMLVQYILKNESDSVLNATFTVENNFAHTNFNAGKITYFDTEVIDDGGIIKLNPEENSSELFKIGKLLNVNMISITDFENGVNFGLEPNENTGFFYMPLIFKRPDKNGASSPAQMTFVEALFWDLEIEPGKEIEKTINFTFRSVRKEKK